MFGGMEIKADDAAEEPEAESAEEETEEAPVAQEEVPMAMTAQKEDVEECDWTPPVEVEVEAEAADEESAPSGGMFGGMEIKADDNGDAAEEPEAAEEEAAPSAR